MSHKHSQIFAGAALGVLLAGASAANAEPAAKGQAPTEVAGVQIAIDPATGRLREPTLIETRYLSEEFAKKFLRTSRVPQATYWPDGTVSLTLDGGFLSAVIVGIGTDGHNHQTCVEGLDAAAAAVAAGGAGLEER